MPSASCHLVHGPKIWTKFLSLSVGQPRLGDRNSGKLPCHSGKMPWESSRAVAHRCCKSCQRLRALFSRVCSILCPAETQPQTPQCSRVCFAHPGLHPPYCTKLVRACHSTGHQPEECWCASQRRPGGQTKPRHHGGGKLWNYISEDTTQLKPVSVSSVFCFLFTALSQTLRNGKTSQVSALACFTP